MRKQIKAGDMRYTYTWRDYPENDPRVSGELSETPFDRKDGAQVAHVLGHVLHELKTVSSTALWRLEELCGFDMPKKLKTQKNAADWLVKNF